uniref:Uncharacterized protein n=1 Tax=Anguilla anguilla TaxID=7936 RepID=A0A0E9QBC7_ANGAN
MGSCWAQQPKLMLSVFTD